MSDGLNSNHKRRLLHTLAHVDNMLREAFQALESAETPSPFQRYQPDSLPVQRKVIGDYLARLRDAMVRTLESQGIAASRPSVSAIWSFRTALMSAKIAVEELRPKYMRGYGELAEEAAQKLEAVSAQLADVLDRMSNYLAQGAGQDLQARLARLEKTTHEVECARAIEQVVAAHGLVELRASLDAVAERLESSRFEIAVFGRVSSGKSSLLNHILRTEVLPVGVTPVTAIPTRVAFGPQPLARVSFAEAKPKEVELHRLAEYVTEQGNPNNTKHVTRIQVELPADRLAKGVAFVDTPGLGSLARYGEMESLAYLPRCDLGLVLVDAGSTLIPEDAGIVNALRQAGAEVMVLLTKADVLAAPERTAAAAYVKDQLRANLGFDVPVHIISVKGSDADLCRHWFETALAPCLEQHRQLAAASLRRKVGLLREATLAALQRRLDNPPDAAAQDSATPWAAVEPVLNEAVAKLETATWQRLEWPELAERVLDAAAMEMVDEWRRNGAAQANATSQLASCAQDHVRHLADDVANALARLRDDTSNALRAAAQAAGPQQEESTEIPAPAGMPILDLEACLPDVALSRPRLVRVLKGRARRVTRAQLAGELGPQLRGLLTQYAKQLAKWRSDTLAQMRRSFTAKADFYRAQCGRPSETSDQAALERDIHRLQDLHVAASA